MTTRPNRTKSQTRLERLIQQIMWKNWGAEDYGLIEGELALKRLLDALIDELKRKFNSPVQNCLSDYFGAPSGKIDLEKELTNRRHLLSPDPSSIPTALHLYIKARNDRVDKSQNWNAHRVTKSQNWNSLCQTPEQLV